MVMKRMIKLAKPIHLYYSNKPDVFFVNEIIHFRPPSTYGTNNSIPRPDPVNPPTVPSSSTTMIPNDQEGKIGGDGYGSSKMRASNWRLMGLGMHNLQVFILIQSYFFYMPDLYCKTN